MGYDNIILTVNAVSVIILVLMTLLLGFAARFKGESSYAALIIVLTTVPIYVYNVCRGLGWYDVALILAPLAFSFNFILMPLLWFLAQRGFNPRYRLTSKSLFHFVPAIVMLVLFSRHLLSLPTAHCYDFMTNEHKEHGSWLVTTNYLILSAQLIGYFYIIFRYLHRVKHYIRNHYSETELAHKVWIPRFITLFTAMFVVVMVCHILCPHTDGWLLQLLTLLIMGYLLYSELDVSLAAHSNLQPTAEVVAEAEADFITTEVNPQTQSKIDPQKVDLEQLTRYARQVEEYIRTSGAYTDPKLSLKDVAKATGLSTKNLSRAINTILGKSFFDLVNGFRIEKSKTLLLSKKEKGYTIDTIAEQCGFNSRFTLNAAFKRATGVTTSEWIKHYKNTSL